MAREVAEKMAGMVRLRILRNDSVEAMEYGLRKSISVFVNGNRVPLKMALSLENLESYLKTLLSE